MNFSFVEIIFWSSVFMIFYAYIGYPAILVVLSLFAGKEVDKADITPFVSYIITAYNEERLIERKIQNTLEQDYPKDRMEIIVASDCSTDETDAIAESYKSKGVKLVRVTERRGKESAQKHAIDVADGEILIFSDVATTLDPFGVRNMVKNFNDPNIGCVTSVDRFIDREGNVGGEGIYVKYEMFLRKIESKTNSVVGLSGSFFAARKKICLPWAEDLQSDFNTLLNSLRKGYRGVCDEEVNGYYLDLAENRREFNRKVRTVVRGLRVFIRNISLLNVLKYGQISWQLFSHKLCRWAVPFWLILTLATNLVLFRSSLLYSYLFALQAGFYISSAIGIVTRSQRQFLRIPYFFMMVNLSILIAWYKYLKGEQFVKWEPSKR